MTNIIRTIACSILTLGALLMSDRPLEAGILYDAAADFSPTNNPNGVWTYGQSATQTSAFQLYTQSGADNADAPPANLLDTWNDGTGGFFANPAVFHNGTSGTVSFNGGTITYVPGQLGFHPGPTGQFSIVRFTTPVTGQYSLASAFMALDLLTTSDVHVLLHNSLLFSADITPGQPASFNTTLSLVSGDVLDFKVGYGPNLNMSSDSTGLSVVLEGPSEVPEPASLTLLGLGAMGMAVSRRRSRRE